MTLCLWVCASRGHGCASHQNTVCLGSFKSMLIVVSVYTEVGGGPGRYSHTQQRHVHCFPTGPECMSVACVHAASDTNTRDMPTGDKPAFCSTQAISHPQPTQQTHSECDTHPQLTFDAFLRHPRRSDCVSVLRVHACRGARPVFVTAANLSRLSARKVFDCTSVHMCMQRV